MIPLRNFKRFINKALRQPFYAVGVVFKRLRAHYAYALRNGKSSPPEAVTFFLTRMCNLRCKMCGQWGDHGITRQRGLEKPNDWLTLDEIRTVLNEVKAFSPGITLFGGEPLLHPDFIEIVSSVKSLGLHCLVISNGALLKRFAGDVVRLGLDELNISIDGGKELHDEIRGLPGVFDQIMEGVDEVNRQKARLSKQKPLINLQCTISRYNYERLPKLLAVAERAKANSLTFHNLIFLKKELVEAQAVFDKTFGCSSRDWEGFIFEPWIDAEKLYEKIEEVKVQAKVKRFSVDFYPNFSKSGLAEYYDNPDYLPSEYAPRCVSPWICAYIFPDGDVRPCLNCTYVFGNVKREGFLKAWNSPEAIRYRQVLKKEGIFPACRRCTELYRY